MTEASPYLALKLARELFQKTPQALADEERAKVAAIAARQLEIEGRILATLEAARVVLPPSAVPQTVAEIRGRFGSDAEFREELERSGLDEAELMAAIGRDLRVEAVLDSVARTAPAVTDTDVEIFYLQHAARFRRPEARSLRHILVTINEALPGSGREAARERIEAIRRRLEKDGSRFAEQALKHSECPTAMNGGLLGAVPRGQLYPELEAVAFALEAGAMSGVVETAMGFHLVLCESIRPERCAPLAEVRERLRGYIADSRRAAVQKAWIAALFKLAT